MAAAFPGMAAPLIGVPEACDVFAEFSEASDVDVARLGSAAGEDELKKDRNWELAVVATEVASFEAHRAAGEGVSASLGFSIGAYAALASAGAVTIGQVVRMIDVVLEASLRLAGPFAMIAVTGIQPDEVSERCRPGEVELAAVTVPGQCLLAGREQAVLAAREVLAPRALSSRVLAVRWPLHTSLMKPVARELERRRNDIGELLPLRLPVYSAVHGGRIETPQEGWRLLVEHLYRPQRFDRALVAASGDGFARYVELGPGDSLRRAVRSLLRGEVRLEGFPPGPVASKGRGAARC